KDGVNLILSQAALEKGLISNIPSNYTNAFDNAGAYEFRFRYPVANQAQNIRTRIPQPLYEPTAQQAGASGHKDRTMAPKTLIHHQFFQGALPFDHRSFRCL